MAGKMVGNAVIALALFLSTLPVIVAEPSTNDVFPDPLPSTFKFINCNYSGHRFEGLNAVVFGGTSGIGFATAAMLIQECAAETVVAGRNAAKGILAAAVLRNISQAHCSRRSAGGQPQVSFLRSDVVKRESVRATLDSFRNLSGDRQLHVIVNTAGVGGWAGNLADLPDDVLHTSHDAIYNNLFGVTIVTAEAMRFWKMAGCNPPACPKLGYTPSLVHLSSEQGMTPCPHCALYGASKHGIIGLATSAANFTNGTIRINVVLPGLVDTPLTWNQFRATKSVITKFPKFQSAWQCVVDGKLIEHGECPGGGTGYGCPCEDLRRDDTQLMDALNATLQMLHLDDIINPRRVGAAILGLADPMSNKTGQSLVVDNSPKTWECEESVQTPLYAKCQLSRTQDLGIFRDKSPRMLV